MGISQFVDKDKHNTNNTSGTLSGFRSSAFVSILFQLYFCISPNVDIWYLLWWWSVFTTYIGFLVFKPWYSWIRNDWLTLTQKILRKPMRVYVTCSDDGMCLLLILASYLADDGMCLLFILASYLSEASIFTDWIWLTDSL